MTKNDIVGELNTYSLRISSCDREKRIKEILDELRLEITKWKKQLEME